MNNKPFLEDQKLLTSELYLIISAFSCGYFVNVLGARTLVCAYCVYCGQIAALKGYCLLVVFVVW